MFDLLNNYENKVFISGQELLGVENVDVSYSHSPSITRFLGHSIGNTMVASDAQRQVSFSRYLIYNDPIYSLIVDSPNSPTSGSINYNGQAYGFNSGFLTEYSVNCAVGTIPSVNAALSVYGAMQSGINHSGSVAAPTIYIPNQGSIILTCDNSTTNRVVGFDYSIKINREPIYTIGSVSPFAVITDPVIEYRASVQIDVDDAFLQNSTGFLLGKQNKIVTFNIKSKDNAQVLQQVLIPNASLIGETLASSADGGVKLTLNYVGHS
jgi:hypothetical protein